MTGSWATAGLFVQLEKSLEAVPLGSGEGPEPAGTVEKLAV
jgi:hypothetical protein